MTEAHADERSDLVRLQWVAYHLSVFEFAEAEELGWDGSREDVSCCSKARAALAVKTGAPPPSAPAAVHRPPALALTCARARARLGTPASIAKEEEARLQWIVHHLVRRELGSRLDTAAAALWRQWPSPASPAAPDSHAHPECAAPL